MFKYLLLSVFVCQLVNLSTRQPVFAEEIKFEEGDAFITLSKRSLPKRQLPANVSVITADDIKNSGAVTVAELLNEKPGINITPYGTAGQLVSVKIRGLGAGQTLILIDGRPMQGTSLSTLMRADLTNIPLSKIERIEVVRGANSAAFGANAFSGVINIITKKPKSAELKIAFSPQMQSFDTNVYKLAIEQKMEKSGFLVTVDKNISGGWRKNSDYDSNSMFTKLQYDLGQLGKTELSANLLISQSGIPGQNTTPIEQWDNKKELIAASPKARKEIKNNYVNLKHAMADYGLNFSGYFTDEVLVYTDSDGWSSTDKKSTNKSNQIGCEIQYEPIQWLIAGISIHQDKINQDYPESQKDNFTKTAENAAGFVETKIDWKRLVLTPGIRYDYHSIFGGSLNGRMSIVYDITDKTKLSASAGTAWRAPTFLDLYWPRTTWSEGNENLKPEIGITYNCGVEQNIGKATLKLTLYRHEIENLIAWKDVGAKWRPSNVMKAKMQGAEIEIEHKIAENISQSFNLSSLNSEQKGESDTDYKLSPYTPSYKTNYRLNYAAPFGLSFSPSIEYVSEQYSGAGKTRTKLPAFTLANIRVGYKVKVTEFYFGANNIFDTRYLRIADYPMPGRTFYAGMDTQF